MTRPVTLTPSRSWGGTGALGCVLGFGALHRIPAPLEEPPQAPGETLFEHTKEEKQPFAVSSANDFATSVPPQTQQATNDFLIPADMQFQSPPLQAGAPQRGAHTKSNRKVRPHHAISPATAMDEYFKEGEKKSQEDLRTSSKSESLSLPPPPKASGPRKASTDSQ